MMCVDAWRTLKVHLKGFSLYSGSRETHNYFVFSSLLGGYFHGSRVFPGR